MRNGIVESLDLNDEELGVFLYEVLNPYFKGITAEFILSELSPINRSLALSYYKDDKLVGVFLLKEMNEPLGKVEGKGIRGDVLAIKKEYQRLGIGSEIAEYIKNKYKNDYDY